MPNKRSQILPTIPLVIGMAVFLLGLCSVVRAQEASTAAVARRIGAIKTISGNTLTLTPVSGPEVSVTVEPNARLLRMAPGDKDLKNATPIQLQDLKVGDMVRVRGREQGAGIDALEVLVITTAALHAVSDQIRQDWQKRGMGGLVESVDSATGNVAISIPRLTGKKTVLVHTGKNTVIKRYAPDSFKFEDAKPSTLQDIHAGEQLNARGERSADGNELAAEEIVTGVFPRFTGLIKSVDESAGMITVQDLTNKKTVQVKVTADSQLHKIPPQMAQGFAMHIKSQLPPGTPGAGSASARSSSSGSPSPAGSGEAGPGGSPDGMGQSGQTGGGGMRSGRAPDLQQMLARLPSSTLADLHLQKGDAVMVLGTSGTPSTAITLLSGVEPILQAAPDASQAMMLTPWSLSGAPAGEGAQ